MIVLQSNELLVRVDPAHGAEILDLVNPRTGTQYLGRPPFASLRSNITKPGACSRTHGKDGRIATWAPRRLLSL